MVVTNIINGLTAFGTIAVAAAAIWGDWLRSKLAPLSLTLVGHTLDGDPALFGSGTRVMFYHLKVVNKRGWISARNCRVMLVGLSRRDPGNIFQPVPMSVPQQFAWAPAEFTPPIITVQREQVLDFGYIQENGDSFIPRLYVMPFNFQGYVGAHEAVRYQLQIEAVNFSSPIYVVEVSWDGVWDFVPATMGHHLPIRIIPSPPT
jgi:hypothetical protein